MSISAKLNIALALLFGLGLLLIGFISHHILKQNAEAEVVEQARIMMEAAQAIRKYTVKEIRPLLAEQMKTDFLPQTVPAYSAIQTFGSIRESNPDFIYREAALNPTNPMNRATDWESDVIQQFRNNPDTPQIFGKRETATGPSLFMSKPMKVNDPGCLTCHDTAFNAPRPLLKKYGMEHGFGWKLNEVIGAQIVSVPMRLPIEKANSALWTVLLSVGGVFVALMLILNLFLRHMIIKPVERLSQLADEISSGNMNAAEFSTTGNDEISSLAASFNRMRRSIQNALKLLEE